MARPGTPHLRLKVYWLPVLTGALFLLQWLSPYEGWRILFVGLGAALGISWLWVRTLSHSLFLRREMRFGWAQVGDRLEERFTLENRSFLPAVWVEIRDRTSLPGYCVSQATGIGGHETRTWQTSGTCTQRGVYQIGPTTLSSGDPFGFFALEIHFPATETLTVTPPTLPLPGIQIAPGGRTAEGRPRAHTLERTVSASGVREHAPGEPLRWVHWPTTARRGQLFTRSLEGAPSGDWWILLDLEAAVQWGSGEATTTEHAVILAASLVDQGLRAGRAVALASNSSPALWIPPREGEAQRWRVLQGLAQVQPGSYSLANLLRAERRSLARAVSLILITPQVHPHWVQEIQPLLWAGATGTVLLLDTPSYGAPKREEGNLLALERANLHPYLIPRQLFDRPELHPGRQGQLDFRITPTGRAVLLSEPERGNWKVLLK